MCVIIWIHIKDVCVFGIRIPRVLLPYDKGCMDSGSLSLSLVTISDKLSVFLCILLFTF